MTHWKQLVSFTLMLLNYGIFITFPIWLLEKGKKSVFLIAMTDSLQKLLSGKLLIYLLKNMYFVITRNKRCKTKPTLPVQDSHKYLSIQIIEGILKENGKKV